MSAAIIHAIAHALAVATPWESATLESREQRVESREQRVEVVIPPNSAWHRYSTSARQPAVDAMQEASR